MTEHQEFARKANAKSKLTIKTFSPIAEVITDLVDILVIPRYMYFG